MTTTAGTTSRGYRYPGDASATDVPGDLKKLADDVNADVTAVAANGAVTTAKIADSAVTSAKIADGTIVADDLADGAVTSAKIADGTIATGDLADSAVTSAKIAAGTIVSSDLATSAVATSNIADSAVTSAKIADGTIVNADVAPAAAIDVSKLSGAVASATVGNLLSSNQATGTDTLSDTTGFYLGSNGSSLASSATYAWQGTRSASYVAGGTASAYMNLHPNGSPAGSMTAVTPGLTYTGVAMLRASAADTLRMELWWYNSGGASIGSSTGASITASTSAWTRATVSAAAPAGAAYAQLSVHRQSGTAGSTVYGDGFGLWLGAGGLWAPPGTPIANLGTYTDETVGRRIFTWDTANNRWQMTYGDTGWREINALQTAAALTKFPNAVLSVRRVNSSVDVRWFSDTGTVAGAAVTAICSTLTGFRPGVIQGRGIVGSAVNVSSGLPSVHGVYSDGAALNIATTADSANNVLASLSYTTNDSWPTALPGNAIGTIPQ